MIKKSIEIEDLVRDFPFAVKYLMDRGIKCIACGEPIWGTLEEAAKEKGINDEAIKVFVAEMNAIAASETEQADELPQVINPDKLKLN